MTSPVLICDPMKVKVGEPYEVKTAGMPTDEQLLLAERRPDGEESEAELGEEPDGDYTTQMAQGEPGVYGYELRRLSGDVLASGYVEVEVA